MKNDSVPGNLRPTSKTDLAEKYDDKIRYRLFPAYGLFALLNTSLKASAGSRSPASFCGHLMPTVAREARIPITMPIWLEQ